MSGATLPIACGIPALGLAVLAFAAWRRRGPEDTFGLALVRFANILFLRTWHRLRTAPRDPRAAVPMEGPAIVAANHRSGLDPMAIQAGTQRAIRWLMAREYYRVPFLYPLYRMLGAIPVNRDGLDLGATKRALRILEAGGVVGIFPSGAIHREDVPDQEPASEVKSGAALLALRTGAPVIPVRVRGTPNVDSVLLALILPSRARVHFGPALRLGTGAGKPGRDAVDAAARRIAGEIDRL